MSDVKIIFSSCSRHIGEMTSSLEAFDAAKHQIPKRILNKIRNSESVEISFFIDNEDEPIEKLDKSKLIAWMYEF